MRLYCVHMAMIISGVVATAARADDGVRGAEYVLNELQHDPHEATVELPADLQRCIDLDHALVEYRQHVGMLVPEQAAAQWLDFYDRAQALQRTAEDPRIIAILEPVRRVMDFVPPPATWHALSGQIDAKPTPKTGMEAIQVHVLRFVGHRLVGNRDAQQRDIDAIVRHVKSYVANVENEEVSTTRDDFVHPSIRKVIDHSIELVRSAELANKRVSLSELWQLRMKHGKGGQLELLSGLSTDLGNDAATPVLLETLKKNKTPSYSRLDKETQRLARQLVLKHPGEIRVVPLDLVPESQLLPTLRKMLRKKAPENQVGSYLGDQLHDRYLKALLSNGQEEEAKKYLLSIAKSYTDMDRLEYFLSNISNFADPIQTYEINKYLVKELPVLVTWRSFLSAAADVQRGAEAVELSESFLATASWSEDDLGEMKAEIARCYLADGNLSKTVELLRQFTEDATENRASRVSTAELAYDLLICGKTLGDQDAVQVGAAAVFKFQREFMEYGWAMGALRGIEELRAIGKARDAEQMLMNALQANLQSQDGSSAVDVNRTELRLFLRSLAGLYLAEGRFDDVLALAEKAPWWGWSDVGEHCMHEIGQDVVAYQIAAALLGKSRVREALPIIHALLQKDVENDDYYALLVSAEGKNAIASLDELAISNPFEQRPLVWKAKVLFDEGDLEQAEKIARQALAIDPLGDEHGKENRLLVYGVLADILEKRGEEHCLREASVYRGAVKAARTAEQADRLRDMSLHRQAVEKYQAALQSFPNACCIHLRLGGELERLDRKKDAVAHYQRAFELMPETFGRRQSHCRGCARIFEEEPARQLAEQTFLQYTKTHPENPRTYYLLGRVYQAAGKDAEALRNYRIAVKLDPQYYAACSELADLARQVEPPGDEEAEIALAIWVLPHQRPFAIEPAWAIRDLPRLWSIVEDRLRRSTPIADQLWPLPAAAEVLRNAKPLFPPSVAESRVEQLMWQREAMIAGPGEVMFNQCRPLMQAIDFLRVTP